VAASTHEDIWQVAEIGNGGGRGELRFIRPDGRAMIERPEPDPVSRERTDRLLDAMIRPLPFADTS